ncbi:MAG: MerR family transcriptional regulator [Bacteroidetes bacterium]|nr:MerR family transcriptional regulator [Bacteroidota bacterium]
MNLFSISQLEQFSGIKAHTIRIWEKRYNALSPDRTDGNTRFYDSSQLRRLLNIKGLMEDGYKPAKICKMPDSKLFQLVEDKLKAEAPLDPTYEYYVSQLIVASTGFNETYFEKIFSSCVLRHGMKETYTKVVYPLLNRIGLMWAADRISPAYEYFCSNLVKQKLYAAIDSLPPPSSSRKPWLLFLPEDEFHEIGLLFAYYIIRHSGKKAVYLGSNVPLDTLKQAISEVEPAHLFMFFVHYQSPEEATAYIKQLKKFSGKAIINIAANERAFPTLKSGKEFNPVSSVEELEKQLA